MSRLRLEVGESGGATRCECCGTASRSAHGFVYRDEDAYAVYYAGWSDAHPDRGVSMAIAVGKWTEESSPSDRVSMGVRATPTKTSVNFTVLNPDESPWGDTPLLGTMLRREQALAHATLAEVMHVAEHVVRDDARVRCFLDSLDVS